jgi:hypothetical protein
MANQKIIFIDNIGRTILGEQVSSSSELLTVKNPVMIHTIQGERGQLQVQLIPLYFTEFLPESKRGEGSVWAYKNSSITVGVGLEIDERLAGQYERIFNPSPIITPTDSGNVVKLFDDEAK